MGWWQVSADTLARVRFVLSPLAEVIAVLKTLERATAAHPGERVWLDAHLPAYRARIAGDPVTGLLIRAALGSTWNATFLTPTPTGEDEPDFARELSRIRRTPSDTARADLTVSLGVPLPAALHRDDLADRTADLLQWIWDTAVADDWPRRREIIKADIVARTARLSEGGWAAALDGMRPGMRWLGDGRLQITAHDHPPRELSAAQLMFVPVTPCQSWLCWDSTDRNAVVYPCSGALAGVGRAPLPDGLGRLLGSARAGVLVLLGSPMTTTELVAVTGQGLGSVGRHLRVLFDAGLVHRRRTGRSVLYYRTEAGDVLVAARRGGGGLSAGA